MAESNLKAGGHAAQPVRPDLAAVAPMYYPILEHSKFGSIKAMCARHGWPLTAVQGFVDRALLEQSEMVVIDQLTLGKPEDKIGAVLFLRTGGAVMLCAGLFAEMSEDQAEVQKLAEELAADPQFAGKFVGVGEFRPNSRSTH